MNPRIVLLAVLISASVMPPINSAAAALRLSAQTRDPVTAGLTHQQLSVDPRRTALVVIDMWDRHWCKTYSARVAGLVPRLNETVAAARALGMQIVWAPSDVLDFYQNTPQRIAATAIPRAPEPSTINFDPPPAPRGDRCECGPEPSCKPFKAWSRQHREIEIHPDDLILDCNDGRELLSLCAQRGIDTLLYAGVASNMCICYRSCGMINMRRHGLRPIFIADLVEAITANGFDPATGKLDPGFTPAKGTWRVQQFLEQHVAPSIQSAQLLAAAPHSAEAASRASDRRPHIVFVVAEDEYDSRARLEAFAKDHLEADYRCTFLGPEPTDPHSIPGLGILADADAVVLSVRRRFLPVPQMDHLERYIRAGKPLVALRVSAAAFAEGAGLTRPGSGRVIWQTFDQDILGCRYDTYDPQARRTGSDIRALAVDHPILRGLENVRFHSSAWIYRVVPLASDTTVLLEGSWSSEQPSQPVAWTRPTADGGRLFYTSLGHPDDFGLAPFQKLLANAISWVVEKPATTASASPAQPNPPAAPPGFKVADGLQLTVALSEPDVVKPVYLTFDERGRLWVVQYLQYPFPAGLKVVGHDEYWRVRYDRFPPPPPPRHFPGADMVTIYEDSDADGRFEKVRDFVTGLNICTAALPGRGGVWVMNPPYLLFYPDANGDDVPDSDPEVHLEGFGLEDLHAVANSLTWGPDGWLYGCQGSTCTAAIRRPGLDTDPLHFKGQCIWRYHPESRRFELFAEGGFNNFGIAVDRDFNLFTGSNGGVIGVHYVQQGYYRKLWGKHGPLTNPYALGWLDSMKDTSSGAKLSQAMIIYEADALPASFRGKMLVARVLQRRIDLCELTPHGSTFSAREVEPILTSDNPRFRPVDLKIGPDGAVYIADWHESNVTWNVTAGGEDINRGAGRIYRLASSDRAPFSPLNLARQPSSELIDALTSTNIWHRQMALRILWDRRDPELAAQLLERALSTFGPESIEYFWAAVASSSLNPSSALPFLQHPNPAVRRWTVRFLGDDRLVSSALNERLVDLARTESDSMVRSQLASTARVFPPSVALNIAGALARRAEDADDPHLPLLVWWVVEAAGRNDRAAVLDWLRDPHHWSAPLFRKTINSRLGERFAMEATPEALAACASLLRMAPDPDSVRALIEGMARGLAGKELPPLPEPLSVALAELKGALEHDPGFLLLGLRLGWEDAIRSMAGAIASPTTAVPLRLQFLRALADAGRQAVVPPALELLRSAPTPELRAGAIEALQRFSDDHIGAAIVDAFPSLDEGTRRVSLPVLTSRPAWARAFLQAVSRGVIPPRSVPIEIISTLRASRHPELQAAAQSIWGPARQPSENVDARMKSLLEVLQTRAGNPAAGRVLFDQLCATCHTLFQHGASIGPDLTGIDRQDRAGLLRAILDPSEVVLPEYQGWEFELANNDADADSQIISGFIEKETDESVTVRNTAGSEWTISKANIRRRVPMTVSIMPEGLLDTLSHEQVADLFSFLQAEREVTASHGN